MYFRIRFFGTWPDAARQKHANSIRITFSDTSQEFLSVHAVHILVENHDLHRMFDQNCETIQPIVRGESDTVLMVQQDSILNRNDRTADRIATEVAQVRALENTGQAMLRTAVEDMAA